MGIVASLAASQVAQEVMEDEARRELVRKSRNFTFLHTNVYLTTN